MKVLYVCRLDGADLRAALMCNSLQAVGHEVVFVGWDRDGGRKKVLLNESVKQRVLVTDGDHNTLRRLVDFVRLVWKSIREEKPDVVQAVNEDVAVMTLPLKGAAFRRLVLDVYDSVIANPGREKVGRFVRPVIRKIGNAKADRIIETWEALAELLGPHQKKSVIIANCCPDPGAEHALKYPTCEEVLVSVGGTLSRKRDQLDVLVAAAERCPPGSVRIMASGLLRDDYARDVFAKHPLVTYRWLDKPRDFLCEAAATDAILYLRGDAAESEYRARVVPNRLFDALSIGRPLIISSDTRISEWVAEHDYGFAWKSGDVEGLSKIFLSLKERRKSLPEFAARLRRDYVRAYTWACMEQRLKALYDELHAEINPGKSGAE
jgi:glycosyltransferase involved in cell wall biosynthesis